MFYAKQSIEKGVKQAFSYTKNEPYKNFLTKHESI